MGTRHKFKQLQTIWTPVFTGVTTFYEFIRSQRAENWGLRIKGLNQSIKIDRIPSIPEFLNS